MFMMMLLACTETEPELLQGTENDVTFELGEHDGFTVGRCAGEDSWWIEATGSTTPELHGLLYEAIWSYPSVNASSAAASTVTPCRQDGSVDPSTLVWAVTSDYAEVDLLIEDLGSRLRDADAAGHLQIDVAPAAVALVGTE